ncbi:MAG: SDR family oxidoreductase [Clostridiales bacterium]|jgi:NAD(P)-dependent dehydrogenase (short-subunit alcohol dehydrogenase family)|nr:SDR family oxidoreductase [Clostridiales bacterium]
MGILEKLRLDGKAALVTGGARGIGKSVAIALAEAGADAALVDTDIAEAEKAAEEISRLNTGVRIIAVKADVTDEAQVDTMTGEVLSAFGRLDIAFCNAGVCVNTPAEEMTLEQWKKVIDVNLTGVFLTARAAGRVMIARGGGSIINTASMSGHIVNYPQPQCAYNASKAAVIQLTKSLAVEWASKNVRVNSISPGYIGTDLVLNAPHLAPLIEKWESVTPVRRMGRPDELQAISVYLAGDSSAFTTGADFVIDGAFTCV